VLACGGRPGGFSGWALPICPWSNGGFDISLLLGWAGRSSARAASTAGTTTARRRKAEQVWWRMRPPAMGIPPFLAWRCAPRTGRGHEWYASPKLRSAANPQGPGSGRCTLAASERSGVSARCGCLAAGCWLRPSAARGSWGQARTSPVIAADARQRLCHTPASVIATAPLFCLERCWFHQPLVPGACNATQRTEPVSCRGPRWQLL